jgi:hypothetical protein
MPELDADDDEIFDDDVDSFVTAHRLAPVDPGNALTRFKTFLHVRPVPTCGVVGSVPLDRSAPLVDDNRLKRAGQNP